MLNSHCSLFRKNPHQTRSHFQHEFPNFKCVLRIRL